MRYVAQRRRNKFIVRDLATWKVVATKSDQREANNEVKRLNAAYVQQLNKS